MSERFLKGRLLVEKRERRQEEAEGFSLTEETRSLYEHQKHKLIRGNQKKSFGPSNLEARAWRVVLAQYWHSARGLMSNDCFLQQACTIY